MQLEENKIAEEIQKMEYEPLLPVEKKLIACKRKRCEILFLPTLWMVTTAQGKVRSNR